MLARGVPQHLGHGLLQAVAVETGGGLRGGGGGRRRRGGQARGGVGRQGSGGGPLCGRGGVGGLRLKGFRRRRTQARWGRGRGGRRGRAGRCGAGRGGAWCEGLRWGEGEAFRQGLKLDLYLYEMLRASAQHEGWDRLPAAAGHRLLAEVVRLNHPDLEEERAAEPPALTQALIKVCRALGLTPSQVRALPAAEVDRVLDLLALEAVTHPDARSRRPRRPKLADHPDAVVILAED